MSMLEIKNISKSFGKAEVLKDISFSVEKGQAVSIIGPSGSGKSTLLRIVNQLEKSNTLQSPLQISILSGIMIADELYKEQGRKIKLENSIKKNNADEQADKITKELIEKIDKVL